MTRTRIIGVYGSIAGIILAVSLGVAVVIGQSHDIAGMAFGYLTMLVALSMVFVGIKKYRDETLGGVIGFGHALLLGIAISLVASVFYVLTWEAYMAATGYSFMEEYSAATIAQMQESGASAAAIEATRAEMASFTEMYANPLLRMAMTFTELAPVALAVTVLSALALCFPGFMPAKPAD